MGSEPAVCPRCEQPAETLQFVPPDLLTNELLESIEDGDSLSGETGDVGICRDCLAELKTA